MILKSIEWLISLKKPILKENIINKREIIIIRISISELHKISKFKINIIKFIIRTIDNLNHK